MANNISRIAEMLEVSPQSLRKWEKQGLIPAPHRRPTGHRDYSIEDIKAITEIRKEDSKWQ